MSSTPRVLPLTPNQEEVLVTAELLGGLRTGPACGQFQVVCRIQKPVDAKALQTALDLLVQRHEALRTTFHCRDRYVPAERAMHLRFAERTGLFVPGFFVQHVHPSATVELTQRQCARGSSDDEQVIWDEVLRETSVGLALNVAPTFRAVLVDGGPWTSLILVMTHLTVDGRSVNLLIQELEHTYRALRDGLDSSLPPVETQWSEFVMWQHEQFLAGSFADAEGHWCRQWLNMQLDNFRFDRTPFAVRSSSQDFRLRGQLRRLILDDQESAAMRSLLKRCRATPYLVFRTALTTLWSRYTGATGTMLWANFTNRRMPRSEGMIGWCANTHVVPVTVDWHCTFEQLCERVSEAISAATMHESLPVSRVWRRFGENLYRTSSYIMCDVFPARQSDSVTALEVVMPPKGLPTLDLDVRIVNERGRYGFMAMFNAERYDPVGVEVLLRDVLNLIMSASVEPDRPLPHYLDAVQIEAP